MSTAPYNFVRLPQKPMSARDIIPDGVSPWLLHNEYSPGLHTGYLDVTVTALTPLFIGGATVRGAGGSWQAPTRDGALRSFRLTENGDPVIPGSSLRGCLAPVLRVLGFSRPGQLNTRTLWMRQPVAQMGDVASERRKAIYLNLLGTRRPPASAGFLRYNVDDKHRGWWIEPLDTHDPRPPQKLIALRSRALQGELTFLEHARGAPLKVRDTVITRDLGGWTPPGADINYRPLRDNPDHFQAQVAFVTATVTTVGASGRKFQRVNVVVGLARPSDTKAVSRLADLHQALEALQLQDPKAQELLAEALPPGNAIVKVENAVGVRTGMLVLTGATGNARINTYVFPFSTGATQPPLLRAYRTDLHDNPPLDDVRNADVGADTDSRAQITQWQRETFPDEKNRGGKPGGLRRSGKEPVWFVGPTWDGDKWTGDVTSLGRAGGYRVVYPHNPATLLPRVLRRSEDVIDVADALLGATDLGPTSGPTMRGRLIFGHGRLEPAEFAADLELRPLRVQMFSPHAESFPMYLTPNGPVPRAYNDSEAQPRGFKFYWHRHDRTKPPEKLPGPFPADDEDTATSTILPLRPGVQFRHRVRFHNLSDAELGLLLRAVQLANADLQPSDNPTSAHKLGHGRPLGLGSVHLTAELTLLNAAARYAGGADFDPRGGWQSAVEPDKYLEAYDVMVLAHANATGESRLTSATGWDAIDRLRELECLTRWAARLHPSQTAPMPLEDFASDSVLPTVLTLCPPR